MKGDDVACVQVTKKKKEAVSEPARRVSSRIGRGKRARDPGDAAKRLSLGPHSEGVRGENP